MSVSRPRPGEAPGDHCTSLPNAAVMDTPPPIRVNRAPVLTLWATVVAERLGYAHRRTMLIARGIRLAQGPSLQSTTVTAGR